LASTCFYIGLYTHAHWGFLVQAFENLVLTRQEQFPIERTLLANGIMLAGLESRSKGGAWVDTPHLHIAYSCPPALAPTTRLLTFRACLFPAIPPPPSSG